MSTSLLDLVAANIEREGGEEWVLDRIAAGDTEGSIARDVGGTRRQLRLWGKATPERATRYRDALRESKDAHAEMAGEVLLALLRDDEGGEYDYAPTREHIAAAKEIAAYHRWMAESREREQYAKSEVATQVVLNVGELHLAALQQRGASSLPVLEAQVEPCEITDGVDD